MGLDVYCEWPNMTEEEKQARYTGFQTTGKNGYLRKSWGDLEAWNNVFKAIFGISWSNMLFPEWNGYNDGEGPDLSKLEERQRLEGVCKKLTAYINNPSPIPEHCKQYFSNGGWANASRIIAKEAQEMVDFIRLALNKEGATIQFS